MTEKPLHVRVAEALGWTGLKAHHYNIPQQGQPSETWAGMPPEPGPELTTVYRYDTDWSATGPLIERLGISLLYGDAAAPPGQWIAETEDQGVEWYPHRTPLIAVCNLILALHEAGKL